MLSISSVISAQKTIKTNKQAKQQQQQKHNGVSVADPDLQMGGGGHPDPEIGGGFLQKFVFCPSGLNLV